MTGIYYCQFAERLYMGSECEVDCELNKQKEAKTGKYDYSLNWP